MRQAHIVSIGTALPRYKAPQSEVAAWAKKVASARSADPAKPDRHVERAIDRVYGKSAIEQRASVVPDYVREPDDFTFYPKNWQLEPSPSTGARMELFRSEAPPLAIGAASQCLERAAVSARSVSHLIVVTCTGFFAPGIDTQIVRALNLRPDVERLQIGFMGCYAAFNALRTARSICGADPEACVLVVCVELCSIHFQNEYSLNNVVANCLFSDGAAAALVASEPEGSSRGLYRLAGSHTVVAPDSDEQMTWTVIDTGFQMALTADVPDTLRGAIPPFVNSLLSKYGLQQRDVGFWAVHPGGRRIVEAVRDGLELDDNAVRASFDVLAANGNMSSPTILFVLDRCRALATQTGALGVALAFGPGLTLESMLLERLSAQ